MIVENIGGVSDEFLIPKSKFFISQSNLSSVDISVDSRSLLTADYTDFSQTEPHGHTNTAQLISILIQWVKEPDYFRDASDRIRMSNINTIAEYSFCYSVAPYDMYLYTINGGTIEWTNDTKSAILKTGVQNTARCIFQTKRYFRKVSSMCSGCSMSVIVRNDSCVNGITTRWGVFDDMYDKDLTYGDLTGLGAYFQYKDGVLSCGKSGYRVDLSTLNIWILEYSSSMRTIRFGLTSSSIAIIYCHIIKSDYIPRNNVFPQISLPVRIEATNSTEQVSLSRTDISNILIYAEGSSMRPADLSYIQSYTHSSACTPVRQITADTDSTVLTTLCRSAGVLCRKPLKLKSIDIYTAGSTASSGCFIWKLIMNPTLDVPPVFTPDDSYIQRNDTIVSLTEDDNTHIIESGIVAFDAAKSEIHHINFENEHWVCSNIGGNGGDIYSIKIQRFPADSIVEFSCCGIIKWVIAK